MEVGIMTPKEKAKELVEKFNKATTYKYQEYAGANYSTFEHDIEELKQCALIAVDEILSNDFLEPQIKRHIGNVEPSPIHLEYWQQIKIEIEAL
jgi:hypothetical protein